MSLFLPFANASMQKLYQSVVEDMHDQQESLDMLLDLTVLKTVARSLDVGERKQALALFRADHQRLALWITQDFPGVGLTISEALTRVLLALTVE
jgi:hypothetical protein